MFWYARWANGFFCVKIWFFKKKNFFGSRQPSRMLLNLTVVIVICSFLGQISGFSIFGWESSSQTKSTLESSSTASEGTTGRFINTLLSLTSSFTSGNDRGPSHDTPPTPCRCRCGEPNYAARIIGGEETEPNEYPWIVRLSYFGRFYCGGTLINDRYVLTAAHCVRGFMWFMIKVTLGEHNHCKSNFQPETRYVLRAISRPYSVATFDDDIALLRLNDRVPINNFIRPICLPPRRASNYAGTKAIVAGWGATSEEGNSSCTLRDVKVPIMTNLDCIRSTSYVTGMITENMMCAGYVDGEEDSCHGDSGGPLIVERRDKRFELAGVVSWGIGCGRLGYPGVYTRVSRYLNWIRQNTRDACYCRN